jgi:periplasmic protein TonB
LRYLHRLPNLNIMSPVSLLFSSDEEMSRLLGQALRELDFDVEYCPEIFSAVEKLTSRSYDVVIADWSEGLEAMFVLKTTHELESNRKALTIAVAGPDTTAAARQAGAELVICRPIVPQKAKHSLLTCKAFVDHMPAWLPKLGFRPLEENAAATPVVIPTPRPWPSRNAHVQQPSPPVTRSEEPLVLPVVPAIAFEEDFIPNPTVQRAFSSAPRDETSPAPVSNKPRRALRMAAVVVTTASVVYVCSLPVRTQNLMTSLGTICGRALDRSTAWLHHSETTVQASTEPLSMESTRLTMPEAPARVEHIRRTRERSPATASGAPVKSNERPPSTAIPVTSEQPRPVADLHIPESLQESPQSAQTTTKSAVSLATSLEPIDLPEELARKLLVETVLPKYPEEALRAGMQGAVVLQAWIGRDGNVLDLKLIRGSFVLGQAAYQAVKHWRFQPYIRNGRALEAQTYITVNFKLP